MKPIDRAEAMSFEVVDNGPAFEEVRLERARVVDVERDFGHERDTMCGVLVGFGEMAKFYLVVHDLIIANGVSMVRSGDVVSEKAASAGDFYRRVLIEKLGASIPVIPKLHEVSFLALCRWLERSGRVAAFHEEHTKDAGCMVGRVCAVSSTTVTLQTLSMAGELDEDWHISFEDLTRIDCLGEYERSFELAV